ncbi:MAG: LysM peptidoglycan-binding domain-containing protein, partial [Acidimicrobiales bacterium]
MAVPTRVAGALLVGALLGPALSWVTAAPATAGTRTVVAGETLSGVAASLGVSVGSLAEANGITDIHRIQAGRK